jgi:uncharacterized membrane protein
MTPIFGLLVALVVGLIVLALLGLVLQWLWNSTLPEVLGVKEVSVIQAIKILLIASILFGGHRAVRIEHIYGGGPPLTTAFVAK